MKDTSQMQVSIFTPTHKPDFIRDCYRSLVTQSYSDWEWVVVLNNGARQRQLPKEILEDERVVVVRADTVSGVGEAKSIACNATRGQILVELDHDDQLLPTALQEVVDAFNHNPQTVFVYSNTAQMTVDGKPHTNRFSEIYGWRYRETEYDGQTFKECITFEPHPHNVSFIWYAPNHLRAFRRDSYYKAGGYNETLKVLDDQDLMARLYTLGEFIHIDKLLYLQRSFAGQTQVQKDINRSIQSDTLKLHAKYIGDIALAWAKRNGLLALDMGAAHRKKDGYSGCDIIEADGIEFAFDASKRWPFKDNSVGVIRAVDFLEHIQDKVHVIKEIYRVLAHGGMLLSMTPSTGGRGAFQDPTHCAFYNPNSFWYYTKKQYNNFVSGLDVRFQVSYLSEEYPSDWHRTNYIPYVFANLVAIKEDSRDFGGLLEI